MLAQIMHDCGQLDLKKYPDNLHVPRPAEPGSGSGTLIKQFQQAVDLAEDGRFEEAIKRFRNLATLDYDKWGQRCQQWITRLQIYGEIAELADHKSTLGDARSEWDSYLQDYADEFDPLKVRAKLTAAPPKPAPHAASQPKPTEKQLSAEEYFARGVKCFNTQDYDGAITNYTEAIRAYA